MLRAILLGVIVLGVGGLAAVGWVTLRPAPVHRQIVQAPPPPVTVTVLAAARPLRAGSLLKFDDITARAVPASARPAGALADTPAVRAELNGAMLRRSLQAQDVVLPADVLRPGDHGFLAAVLRPGMRATTVGVDAVTGTAGLIWPGDRVDLILTQVQTDAAVPASHRASAEIVLEDVRVIAIDQQLTQGATGSSPERPLARTVTLEVTPGQAERVALADRLGRLALAVRSAAAAPRPAGAPSPDAKLPPVTWGGDVSAALDQGRPAGQVVRLFQGRDEGKELRF
ncbi:MAG: Flp pilus assembly protein CpaB [Rhodospirillales bacterium]|nr:Flp pilus assembly protein CpaB [Rhodospirillales bacterium]MDE2576135.1 Flp pilus assembly protein CpaB [Rhodospirillales bacterium]